MDLFSAIFFFVLLAASQYARSSIEEVHFDVNYNQTYGGDHLTILDNGQEVQLLIDQKSGAGFTSKQDFGSGYFGINMKISNKDTTGLIASFYLTAIPLGHPAKNVKHYEFDFEFFGTDASTYNLSTNVYANDLGHKEQQFNLWFDPSADFHKYEILWNQHQIAWFVDETPVRVWKNLTNLGVGFPTGVAMHLEASLWNPSFLGKPDWSQGPFTVHYRGFDPYDCPYQSSNPQECYSSEYYWNQQSYWQLSPDQQTKLQNTRNSYLYYDYCNNPTNRGPECRFNQ